MRSSLFLSSLLAFSLIAPGGALAESARARGEGIVVAQAAKEKKKPAPKKVSKPAPKKTAAKPASKGKRGKALRIAGAKKSSLEQTFRNASRARERAVVDCGKALSRLSPKDVRSLGLERFRRAVIAYRRAHPAGSEGALANAELRELAKTANAFRKSKQSRDRRARGVLGSIDRLAKTQRAMRDAKAALALDTVNTLRASADTKGSILLVAKEESASTGKSTKSSSSARTSAARETNDEEILIGSATTTVSNPPPVSIEVTVVEEPPESTPAVLITPSGNQLTETQVQAITAAGGIQELRAELTPPSAPLLTISPSVVVETDRETLSLFEFAEQTGNFENIVIDAAPAATCGEADVSGYAGLFSFERETTDCVAVPTAAEIRAMVQENVARAEALAEATRGCTVTLYEHSRYRGKTVSLTRSRTTIDHLKDYDLNDKVTSVKVDFSNCPGSSVTLYRNDGYRRELKTLTRSSSNIGEAANDETTSVRFSIAD